MSVPNYVRKVAIVGAGGTVGKYIAQELVRRGRHEVTAISREGSASAAPEGVRVARVDYADRSSLAAALRGHDALVITLSTSAPRGTQELLAEAAAEARVGFVLPNCWGPDQLTDEAYGRDTMMGPAARSVVERVEQLGRSSWVAVSTGFWYQHSLAIADAYGMDWAAKKFTFFDDGRQQMSHITWPQTGRAVASLLSLPLEPARAGGPSLNAYRNRSVYVDSFRASQRDMLDSVLRVTGGKESDWTVEREGAAERYARGLAGLKAGGGHDNFVRMLYARTFYYQQGEGEGEGEGEGGGSSVADYEHKLDNAALGLEREDLDECTRLTIEMLENGGYKYN